MNFDAN